jgi:hypothetical protein
MFRRFGLLDLLRLDLDLSPRRFRESRVGRLRSGIRGIEGGHGVGGLGISFDGGFRTYFSLFVVYLESSALRVMITKKTHNVRHSDHALHRNSSG